MALTSIVSFRKTPDMAFPKLALNESEMRPLLPFEMLGNIGADLSGPINTIRAFMDVLNEKHLVSPQQMADLTEAVEVANQIARDSQQIARLAEGKVRQSHERISLDDLLRQMLPTITSAGLKVTSNLKPAELIVDASLLSSLLETSFNWAATQGQDLEVSLHVSSWPEHAILEININPLHSGNAETSKTDSLNWQLLTHLAQTMGAKVKRECSVENGSTLTFEFSRTVSLLEGLTSTEIHTGEDSAFDGTRSLAGQRVLLISDDIAVGKQVQEAGQLLELAVRAVKSVAEAWEIILEESPHIMVVDEGFRCKELDKLIDSAKKTAPHIGLLEIAKDSGTFEISSWTGNSMTRLSRDVLDAKLVSVLSLELARAL